MKTIDKRAVIAIKSTYNYVQLRNHQKQDHWWHKPFPKEMTYEDVISNYDYFSTAPGVQERMKRELILRYKDEIDMMIKGCYSITGYDVPTICYELAIIDKDFVKQANDEYNNMKCLAQQVINYSTSKINI